MDSYSSITTSNHLLEYVAVIRKRIWMVVGLVTVVCSLAVYWNLKATPIYEATVQILIEPLNPKIVNYNEVAEQDFGRSRYGDYYATQYRLLRGRTLALRTVHALGLADDPVFLREPEELEALLSIPFELTMAGIEYLHNFLDFAMDVYPPIEQVVPFSPTDVAANRILNELDIEPVKGTRLVKVHYAHPNPVMAARIANKLSQLYLAMNLDLRFSVNKGATEWLKNEIEFARETLVKSEKELQAFKEKYNLVSLEDRQNIVSQKLNELNSAYTKAKTETLGIEALVKRIRTLNGNIEILSSLPQVKDNIVLQGLKASYIALLREHSDLTKRYKSGHPKLIRLNSKIRLMKKKIQAEIKEIKDNILTRYQVARARERSLAKSLENQKKESLGLNRFAISYRALKRKVDTNQEIYLGLLKRSKETGLLEKLRTSNIRIVEEAKVPTEPVRPQRIRNILFATGASLFFGLVLTFFIDHLDRRIRTPEQAQMITGAPILGVISDLKHKISSYGQALVARDDETISIGNQNFRELGIMATARLARPPQVILVTSCLPNEGKTFVACNLALMIAKTNSAENRILLIEGDLHRPSFGEVFGNIPSAGLSQVLRGRSSIRETIRRYPRTSLGVLPAGNIIGEVSDILIQSALMKLIDSVRPYFDYVIIDTPPLLSVSDPLIWSCCVDGVFLVVDMNQAKPDILQKGIGKLRGLGVPIRGTIANRVAEAGEYYYDYGDGYRA